MQGADQTGDGLAEARPGFEDDRANLGVASFEIGDRLFHRDGRAAKSCQAGDDGPGAGRRFEAAPPSAAAYGAARIHHGVADLAGPKAIALEELAVQDDAGPDPLADLYHDQVGAARLGEDVLGKRGGLAVVGDVNWDLEALRSRGDREAGPASSA